MITIYTTPSCSSCRKAKQWLEAHQIKYIEKNLAINCLTADDVRQMFNNSRDGYNDILSKRSKIYKDFKEAHIDFDDLTNNQMTNIIITNPSILKRPIIMDGGKMKIGFHEDEISLFVPMELRNRILSAKKGDPIIYAYAPKKYQVGFKEDDDDEEEVEDVMEDSEE